MASILRSSKFVRYIAGFARNVVLSTPREADGNFVNSYNCLCGANPSFATQASVQNDQSLEKRLRTIDQDVRKSGRISRRDIEDVLEEIKNTRTATSSQSLLVIRCCGNLVPEEMPEVRTKLVQEIWNTLNKLNISMDVSHYNALLRVYLENEHSFSPTEFLTELESKGIEPNRVTYQRLIAAYCQKGDIEGATKILEYMREKQLPVNENVFNALIVGHSEASDLESAHGIISVMTQSGLEPSADTYTTLLCGYAKKGDSEAITKLFEECEAKEVFLLDKDYLDIAYALASNGHDQYIPLVLSKVRKAVGYNQDAINVILRLINRGKEEAGFEILKSMPRTSAPDGTVLPTGSFFIKQLIKANSPIEKIIQFCNRFESTGMYERAFYLAVEKSLELGKENLAYPLLKQLKTKGLEVRQHYFWPLILHKAKSDGNTGVVEVLQKMNEFGIFPSVETIREYLIPNLTGKSGEILEILRNNNISTGTSASSLVLALLQQGEIKEAAVICSKVSAFYHPDQMRRPLTQAFYRTNDLNSYVVILREVYENLDRKSTTENENNILNKQDVVGAFLVDLAFNKKAFLEKVEEVLQKLVDQGLSISTSAAEKVQDKLGEKMTDEISALLGKLTSGELIPTPQLKKPPSYTPSYQMNVAQLEKLIENLTEKKQDVRGLKRQLFTLYYREKNLEKMEALLNDFNNDSEFFYNGGIYAQLMDAYAAHDNLEKALENLEKLKEIEKENVSLDDSKIIRLSHLLCKKGRFEDGIKCLKESRRLKNKEDDRSYSYTSLVWRFMNSLAEEGKADDLNVLFETLVTENYITISNVLLGPLVKVHLTNKDLDAALAKMEECVAKYKSTPWKNDLACQLIQAEDAEKLQKLTDLSTSIHGEINSLYDLVFAFIECGRTKQARKILETPGLQNRPQKINMICERYQQEGQTKHLEDLKDATKDLNHIDRTDIYYQLLLSYMKQEETDKAFGLWTQMQEEDIAPTEQFLSALGTYMKERGLEVPFVVPQTPTAILRHDAVERRGGQGGQAWASSSKIRDSVVNVDKTPLQVFRQRMKSNDVDGALELVKTVQDRWGINDLSGLIEKLTQQGRLDEASKIALKVLDKKIIPVNRVFKFLLNKLAMTGEIDVLTQIGSKISQDAKKLVSFDNRMCHANLVVGKSEEYLNRLEEDIVNAKTAEEANAVGEKFPRGGAYGILDKHPELLDKYESLAIKYMEKGVPAPLNVLWTHYFISENYEKAQQLWEGHLKSAPRIMFQRIVQTARDTKNEDLVKNLIQHLKVSNVTEGAIGNAYSCLLDVAVAKNNSDHIIETFEAAVKDVSIDYINRTAILRVKDVYDKVGKEFKHKIPVKSNSQQKVTSSSSSSSDEVGRSKNV